MAKIDVEGLDELKENIRTPLYLIRAKLQENKNIDYSEFQDHIEDIFGYISYILGNWDVRSNEDAFD